ncbi:MAG: hypothetical protein SFX18_08010 [Pirellulales bacterium]|nr:hypothetical protein [Pirellulales bacterium]
MRRSCPIPDTRSKCCVTGGVVLWYDFANYGDSNDETRAIADEQET